MLYVASVNCPPSGTMSGVDTGAGCTKPRNPSPEPRRPTKVLSLGNMCRCAAVAALSLYDTAKAFDRSAEITGLHLMTKSGGKSGDYRRAGGPQA